MRRLLLVGDLLTLTATAALASAYHDLFTREATLAPLVIAFALSLPVWFLLAHGKGLYHLADRHVDHSIADEVGPIFLVATVWIWLLLLIERLIGEGAPQLTWFFVLWLGSIVALLAVRALIRRVTGAQAWFRQSVMLIGDERGIEQVLERVRRHPECGLDPVGSICRSGASVHAAAIEGSQGDERVRDAIARQGPLLPRPAEIVELIREAGIERVTVTGWAESLEERTELIRVLAASGVYVDLVSGGPEALCAGASLHYLEGLPMMTVKPGGPTRTSRALKRALDLALAGAGLVVLAPLLGYVALRIKLDSRGPVLFRHTRAGRGDKPFEMIKFRTMVDGAEAQSESLRSTNGQIGELLKLHDDPRITKFGARLRRSSIDELPQLWNVLRGQMSLVGPRPLPLEEAALARGHYAERLHARPGITGPWQIHGRSDIPFSDMVRLDYSYARCWSLQGDMRLLIRTVSALASRRGAY